MEERTADGTSGAGGIGSVLDGRRVLAGGIVAECRRGGPAREAPTCSGSQLFTAMECRITVDGTMTSLTSDRAEMDVGGRHVSATVTISGTIPDVSGVAVRVTLYRGKPIRIDGQDLKIDTDNAPASSHTDFRNAGMFFLIGGALLVGANVFIGSIGRGQATPPDRAIVPRMIRNWRCSRYLRWRCCARTSG